MSNLYFTQLWWLIAKETGKTFGSLLCQWLLCVTHAFQTCYRWVPLYIFECASSKFPLNSKSLTNSSPISAIGAYLHFIQNSIILKELFLVLIFRIRMHLFFSWVYKSNSICCFKKPPRRFWRQLDHQEFLNQNRCCSLAHQCGISIAGLLQILDPLWDTVTKRRKILIQYSM